MMNFFRKYTRAILIIVILVFVGSIFWIGSQSIGGASTDARTVANVFGNKISYETFMSLYNMSLRSASKDSQIDLTDDQKKHVKTSVLYELIQTEVMYIQAQKYGVDVSDAELKAYLLNNPMFANNNKVFDINRYYAFLNQINMTPKQYESFFRKQVAGNKLKEELYSSVKVFESEFAAAHKANPKVTVSDMSRAKGNQILNEWYMGIINKGFADRKIVVNDKLFGEI